MKRERGGFRTLRRMQLLEGLGDDSYKSDRKLPDSTRCPRCAASFHAGRWTWDAAPRDAREQLCPACHRIHDGFPAGYVTLAGEFFRGHRDEILRLVRHCEEKEKATHPLQRIINIEEADEGVVVTTTDVHLARNIAERVHDAHQGSVVFRYSKKDNLVRAAWKR